MRKEPSEEVAAAARRRLALLGEELARSGFPAVTEEPADAPDDGAQDDGAPLEPAPVKEPGRHSRGAAVPRSDRGVAWLQDRLPATLQGRVSLGVGHVAVLAV